jgi:hypothetical protein
MFSNTYLKIKKAGISISAAIVIAAAILGIAFYVIQSDKQQSIERQQQLERQAEQAVKSLENKRAELKLKQDECESLSDGVKKRWGNVLGVTYDETLWKECVVTYTDPETGEVETSPLGQMKDTSK